MSEVRTLDSDHAVHLLLRDNHRTRGGKLWEIPPTNLFNSVDTFSADTFPELRHGRDKRPINMDLDFRTVEFYLPGYRKQGLGFCKKKKKRRYVLIEGTGQK